MKTRAVTVALPAFATALALAPLAASAADVPMAYWSTVGPAADPVTRLGWGLGIVSVLVVVIVGVLLLAGLLRPRAAAPHDVVGRSGNGLRWIWIGTGISTVVLFGCALWTLETLAAVQPRIRPALTVEVTGHEWWWEFRYVDSSGSTFTTANELHIPVGRPVRLVIGSADVIHSFWVPKLAGKTDAIPGQQNVAWLQADRAGRYRGQCTEYCGLQHAHMALTLVADEPARFAAWRDAQVQPAVVPAALAPAADVFEARCGACHTVRGTAAGGIVGPDLTHVASRATIAAGTLANDRAHLSAWITNAQSIKPGTLMPNVPLTGRDEQALLAFLASLH